MKIMIIGDGKIGSVLAEQLSREKHEVTLVDRSGVRLDQSNNELDVMVVEGDGASRDVQLEAGADQADLVIAVGYDIVEYAPRKWNAGNRHRVLHIDTRSSHINQLYQPEIEVIGDISYSLRQIALRCSRSVEPQWALDIKKKM